MFDATVGGADSTSYVTLTTANDYFNDRLHSDLWASLSDAEKEKALITATRLLERHVQWDCEKANDSQALSWPGSDAYSKYGILIPDNIIPAEIEEAACELAYSMLPTDRTLENALTGISSLKVGPLAITADSQDRTGIIPDHVWGIIGGLGFKHGSGAGIELRRG